MPFIAHENVKLILFFQGVFSDALQSVLSLCLRLDPHARPDIDRIKNYLEAFSNNAANN